MSEPAELNPSPPTSVVRNTVGKGNEQPQKHPSRLAFDAALREYCDKHYHQLLPIITEKVHQEKVQQEKLREVKARINFEGCSRRNLNIQVASQHSESRTPNAMGDLRRRLGLGGRGRSVSAHLETANRVPVREERNHSQKVKIAEGDTGDQDQKNRSQALKKKTYLNHRHVKGAPECMRILGFMHGINNPELIKLLHDNIPKSLDKMMRVTTSFLRGKVAGFNQARKKALSAWKQQEARRKQNFDRKGDFKNQQRSEWRHDKFTLLTKSPKEILALDKGKFKTPPPIATHIEKRNNNKFCEFHGEVRHNTDECMHLKRQIEELIRAGRLSHVIKELKQGIRKDQPKTTKKGEALEKDKAMAPSGSKEPDGSDYRTPNWFQWRNYMANGTDIATSKNKGCGAFNIHMDEFFGVPRGILTLRSSRIIPLECTMVFGHEEQPSLITQVVEEKVRVAIHPEYVEQIVAIGSTLTEEGRKELCGLLRCNLDIFAWKPADMMGCVKPAIPKVSKRRTKAEWKVSKPKEIPVQISRQVTLFFKALKKCTKKSDFQWTAEAEAAFKQMKKLIAKLPTLTAPMEKEELIVYLVAAREAYLEKVRTLASSFKKFSIKRVPISENKKADTLRKIASTSFAHLTKQILMEELNQKSINEAKVLAVMEEEGDTWMTPIYNYLREETLPTEKEKARAVRRKSRGYTCFASIKHPQANGLVERANRSLGEGIKARLDERRRIGLKKSHMSYGKAEIDMVQNDEALEINLGLLEERREQAAIREARSKAKMKKYYNSKVRNTRFNPGDLMYRSNEVSHAEDIEKLGPQWEGPYEVTEALSKGAYKLHDRNGKLLPRT
nr:reverse transcriptase domain-containing protein [Tanacetum cinerariifolium]